MKKETIRPLIMALLGALTALGLIPDGLEQVIEANVDAILGGVLAVWAVIAYVRNRRDGGDTLIERPDDAKAARRL